MKKLILSLIISVSLAGMAFSESIFAHRFFEVKLNVPVSASNNIMGLTEIFQKTVTVDLPKIADEVSLSGGAFIKAQAAPSLSINLDIPNGLILGFNAGAEADVSLGLSKDIFEFIGHGNEGMGTNFTQKTTNTYADLFAQASMTGGWNGKKSRIAVTATGFKALAHVDAGDTYIKIFNNEETNEFGVEAKVDAKLYTSTDINEGFSDIQAFIPFAGTGTGFDLSADVQRDLFRFLTVGAKARIPIVPSKLSMCSTVSESFNFSTSFDELMNGSSEDGNTTTDGDNTSGSTGDEEKSMLSAFTKLDKPYEIHRPLKLGVSANFHPFGTLLTTSGYLGIGVRHPFAKDTSETNFYVDYSVAGRLSLWNVLSFELSHSYYDQIFKNEVALALNIRLIEVDAGVSFTSASFAQSFTGAGLGAFVTVAVGF